MDYRNRADVPSATGLDLHKIEAFPPIRNVDDSTIGIDFLHKHRLPEQVECFNANNTICRNAQGLLRRIRIQLKFKTFVFSHICR